MAWISLEACTGPGSGAELPHRPSSCSSGYPLSFLSSKHHKTQQSCYGMGPVFTYKRSRWYFINTRGSTPGNWFFSTFAFWALPLTCMNLRKITSSLEWQVSSCKINYPLTSEARCGKGQRACVCEPCRPANLKVVLLSQFFVFFFKFSYSLGLFTKRSGPFITGLHFRLFIEHLFIGRC